MTDAANDKLDNLNNTLGNVENRLLKRALDRSRDDADRAYDFINQAADAGLVDIKCDGEDEPEEEPTGGETPYGGDGGDTDGEGESE